MNHSASTTTRGSSILANNENATTELHHHSKLSSNGMKKASFHDNNNNATTPHRNAKNVTSKVGGRTAQRRRRAFGDISNRKVPGGGGGAAAGKDNSVVLKRTSSTNLNSGSLKSTVGKPTTKVQFSTLPTSSAPNTVINNAKFGPVKSSVKKSLKQQQQQHGTTTNAATDDDDDVFSPTTRWAPDANTLADNLRSPFYLVSDEEWNMVTNLREEFANRTQKESEERIRLEIERDEARFMEKIREVNDDALATSATSDVDGLCDLLDGFNALDDKLPWEVEEDDGMLDPTEERRLSGNDPCSLWGDISNW